MKVKTTYNILIFFTISILFNLTNITLAQEPGEVQNLYSTSHELNKPSNNPQIRVTWNEPEGDIEIAGYYTLFNTSPQYTFSEENTLTIPLIQTKEALSPDYSGANDSYIYFHIAAASTEDVIGSTKTYGPIRIDTVAPSNATVSVSKNTVSRTITLSLGATGAVEMYISNSEHGVAGSWEALSSPKQWELTEGEGLKTIYVQFRDRAGNKANVITTTTFDSIPPSISLESTSPYKTNTAPIIVNVNFSENIKGFELWDFFVGNGEVKNFSGSDNSYSVELYPIQDGEVIVYIPAEKLTDISGNYNLESLTFKREFDTVGPAVQMSTQNLYTNTSPISINVLFEENVQGFEPTDIQLINAYEVTEISGADNNYSFEISPMDQGKIIIEIPKNSASDESGNGNLKSSPYVLYYDTVLPSVVITSSYTKSTNISPIDITVTFSEKVQSFNQFDIITNGNIENFKSLEDGTSYTGVYIFNLVPAAQGQVNVSIGDNTSIDLAGNGNLESNNFIINYDTDVPKVTISTNFDKSTNISPIPITFTFSKPVSDFEIDDISFTNVQEILDLTGSDSIYNLEIMPLNEGEITIFVKEKSVFDDASNGNDASEKYSIIYDTKSPDFKFNYPSYYATNKSPIPVTITFSEDIANFESSYISVENASPIDNISGSGSVYSFLLNPLSDGMVVVLIDTYSITDIAGNTLNQSTDLSIEYDTESPTVSLSSNTQQTVNESPIPVTIEFSEAVKGLNISDFLVTNGAVSNLEPIDLTDGYASSYNCNLVPSDQGAILLQIPANAVNDKASNGNSESIQFERTYSSDRPAVKITSQSDEITSESPIDVLVTFNMAVFDFIMDDIIVTNAEISNFQGSDETYSFSLNPIDQGLVTVDIPENAAQNQAGVGNTIAGQFVRTYDINDTPIANPGKLTIDEDTKASITLTATDVDLDDVLSFKISVEPTKGTINCNLSTGACTYSPARNETGQDSFTFVANDGQIDSSPATVDIMINPVNDSPILLNPLEDKEFNQDQSFEFTISDEIFKDFDEFDILTINANLKNGNELPSWITFNENDKTFKGIGTNETVGTIEIIVTATDTNNLSVSDDFKLSILNVNDSPIISSLNDIETNEDTAKSISFVITDIDLDNLELWAVSNDKQLIPDENIAISSENIIASSENKYSITTKPNSMAVINLEILPAKYQFGSTSIEIYVKDSLEQISDTFSISVNPVRYTISGNVGFFRKNEPVNDVLIVATAQGYKSYSCISDSYGNYIIKDIPPGIYSIKASKEMQEPDESLSPMDASIIARYLVGLQQINCYQIIAADATENGDISSMDTSKVARYSAGLSKDINDNGTHWTFSSEEISSCDDWVLPNYDLQISYKRNFENLEVNSNMDNLNFTAIRIGDVTGNWPDEAIFSKKKKKKTNNYTKQTITPSPGTIVKIPVVLDTNIEFYGCVIFLNYDSSVVKITNALINSYLLDNKYTLTPNYKDAMFTINSAGGDIKFYNGTLLTLEVEIVGDIGSSTILSLSKFKINEEYDQIPGGLYINDNYGLLQNIEFYVTRSYELAELDYSKNLKVGMEDAILILYRLSNYGFDLINLRELVVILNKIAMM